MCKKTKSANQKSSSLIDVGTSAIKMDSSSGRQRSANSCVARDSTRASPARRNGGDANAAQYAACGERSAR
jgi:hypothetical protein